MKWSTDDCKWIEQTSLLMEKILGPDNFTFKTINKSVVVHEDSRPEFVYTHHTWEVNSSKDTNNEMDIEMVDLPKEKIHAHTTLGEPKARCSLNTNCYGKMRGTKQTLVPKWGGIADLDDGIHIKLINTCPIDNYLTLFYLYFKSHPDIYNQLKHSPESNTIANYLIQTLEHFDDEEFAIGKVHWLKQFPNFDFSLSGTVNVWGSEQDMIMPCLAPILHSTQETICNSDNCPQQRKANDSNGIFIVSTCVEKKDGESTFEAILRRWVCPEMQKCDARFDQNPPLTVRVRMSEPCLAIPENYWYQSVVCDGSHTSQPRVFTNGTPWVLPVFFGDLAITGHLKGPEDLPEIMELCNSIYHLRGITFWNGNHYIARIHYKSRWYTYDGLQNISLQPALTYSAAIQTGYIMSSCVYFKEPLGPS